MLYALLDLGVNVTYWVTKKTVGGVYHYFWPTQTAEEMLEHEYEVAMHSLAKIYDDNMTLKEQVDKLEQENAQLKNKISTETSSDQEENDLQPPQHEESDLNDID